MNETYSQKLPPQNVRQIIDDLSKVIPDPAAKLKFIKQAIDEHQHLPRRYQSCPALAKMALRTNLLNKAEDIWPGSKEIEKKLIRSGVITAPKTKLLQLHKFRHLIVGVFLVVFIGGVGTAVASFFGTFNPLTHLNSRQSKLDKKQIVRKPIVYHRSAKNIRKPIAYPIPKPIEHTRKLTVEPGPVGKIRKPIAPKTTFQPIKQSQSTEIKIKKYLNDPIWLVEKTPHYEIYSNRLQIITTYSVPNIPRQYHIQLRDRDLTKEAIKLSGDIVGIIYHTSESDLVPFKPEMNSSIKKRSKGLIKYLQRRKSYNYFIDRFGRIFRIVQEDHTAFHAGRSIWADDNAIYIDLNHSFLGICFEGRDFEETAEAVSSKNTNSNSSMPRIRSTGHLSINEAQLRSGKELTDWLRVKYRIAENNCVPHALISINPAKKLIGYHLDLSRGFPFAKFSLNNKYESPLPSIIEFGFSHDNYFSAIFNGEIWPGIYRSEELLQQRALDAGLSISSYRKLLMTRFEQYTGPQQIPRGKKEIVGIAKN
jgi:hypothetical protein